jgi:ABC-type lipoprotein release transport system permease subunit
VLSVLSAVVFFVLPSAFLSGNPSLIGTVVLCLLLVLMLGFTMLAVGAMPWSTRLAMFCIGWTLGPSAELASKNLERNRRRNNTTALMFILSVSMVIFIASLVVLFSHTAMTMVEQSIGADIRLQTDEPPVDGFKSELAQIKGVQGVSEVRMLRSRTENGTANDIVLSDLVGMKSLWVVPFGADSQLTNALYTTRIQFEEGGPEALQKLAAAAVSPADNPTNEYPIILSLAAARFLDARAGELVNLSFRLGSSRAEGRFRVEAVCGVMPGFENFRSRIANATGSGVLIPLNVFSRLTASAPQESVLARYFVRVDSQEESQKSVAGKIREDFDVRYRFGVKSTLEQKQNARILYWVTQVFFGLLLAVAVVISVFALIASMATAVIERRWEIGVLKALGLRRGGLFKMFLGEAIGLTLAAGGSGGVVGFAVAYMFALEASALMEIPMGFTLPYVTFLATFAICLVAGAAAAYYPTRHLLRKSAAEILRMRI